MGVHKPDWTARDAIRECRAILQTLDLHLVGELTVAHLEAAEKWEDRFECLKWAIEARATVKEMIVWHRAQNGLDLFAEEVT